MRAGHRSEAIAPPAPVAGAAPLRFPVGPLLATLAVQTLATGAAYSLPAIAPEVGRAVGINPALVGVFVSIVYGVGIISSLLSPRFIYARGAVRASQMVLLATLAMIGTAALGHGLAILLAAILMGLAYGATAPSSTHLLVPRTPPAHMNVVISLRQIGVPLGGMLAGLLMPPLALAAGWQTALLLQIGPVLALLALLELVRRRWDGRPADGAAPVAAGVIDLMRLLAGNPALQRLSLAAFVYSGLQICFIAFMTTQLTTVVGFSLVAAGQALALYQLSGVISRPIWGWLADNVLAARWLLALHGAVMCAAALLAGRFAPDWPVPVILAVSSVAGATASGYTGIAYAEYARLGGGRRTEATGLGSAFMFAGVMVLPAATSAAVTVLGSYTLAYSVIGLLALLAGLLLALPVRRKT